ncbi:MAG: class I SAM-dependent methyltransferase, partial [Candidatus Thorarchaeota archaeon]
GFQYLDPQPTEEELAEYYRGKYRANSRMAYKRFDRGMWEAKRRLHCFESMCSILEIGSGAGPFIYGARQKGIDITGVEPDEKSRIMLREMYHIPVRSDLSEISDDETFDTIVMFHSLEHIPDPVNYLKRLKKHLKPGGKIVIEVPNLGDSMMILRKYAKEYFYQLAHLWYFNKNTLQVLCQKAGLAAEITHLQRYNLRAQLRWWFKGHNNGDGNEDDLRKGVVSRLHSDLLESLGKADTLWAVAGG